MMTQPRHHATPEPRHEPRYPVTPREYDGARNRPRETFQNLKNNKCYEAVDETIKSSDLEFDGAELPSMAHDASYCREAPVVCLERKIERLVLLKDDAEPRDKENVSPRRYAFSNTPNKTLRGDETIIQRAPEQPVPKPPVKRPVLSRIYKKIFGTRNEKNQDLDDSFESVTSTTFTPNVASTSISSEEDDFSMRVHGRTTLHQHQRDIHSDTSSNEE